MPLYLWQPPSARQEDLAAIYRALGSPIDPLDVWGSCTFNGIDPVVASGFFYVESHLGKLGWARVNANPGNLRLDRKGHGAFHVFAFPGRTLEECFAQGVIAWCEHMAERYRAEGLLTVEQIVPVYAPYTDVERYVAGIQRFLSMVAIRDTSVYLGAQWIPSPNYTAGRSDLPVRYVVMHHTAGTLSSSLGHLTSADSQVSAHFVVDRDGTVYQLVKVTDTAWHAGNWQYNLQSVGIEHVHYLQEDGTWSSWTDEQLTASAEVIKWVKTRYPIEEIIPHRAIVPTECPADLPIEEIARRSSQG